MNLVPVEEIANAVLYEGYLLYPYRPSSVKNRQRWTFGGIFPRAYGEAQGGSEPWSQQTECLVEGDERTTLEIKARFLHLLVRQVGELGDGPPVSGGEVEEPSFRPVESLTIGGRTYRTWQEATEREVAGLAPTLGDLVARPLRVAFAFPAWRADESLPDGAGAVAGMLARRQEPLAGVVEVAAAAVGARLYRVTVRVLNETPLADAALHEREAAQLQSFVSTHTILGVRDGAFVSLLEPPDAFAGVAADCANIGTWPVLVGAAGQRDLLLSSPIILYDYPEIAPESPGDLFDGTEIDEILTLRILAMTDDEKREMREIDERARALLERTENLTAADLLKLHGTMRNAE